MASIPDDELVDVLERAAFGYFLEEAHPVNGLVADTSRSDSPASIAVVGFALSAYAVAVERGWLTREDAARRTRRSLCFLEATAHATEPGEHGHKGFFYHFLDMETGKRAWQCELSPVDTSLLLAGIVLAHAYFIGSSSDEVDIRRLALEIYCRVDWEWARNGRATVAQGWKPECGFFHYGWQGYNEAGLLYVLGLASPTHALPPASYTAWTATYQWERIYGHDVLYAGPLFIHQFAHAWIDFRSIRDPFMREKKTDYFENTRRTIDVQREYARRDPNEYGNYGVDCWGLSAGPGPGDAPVGVPGRRRTFFDYAARGAPYGPDDGTVAPCAVLSSLPFAPASTLSAVRHFFDLFPEWADTCRLPSGFNQTASGKDPRGWVSEATYGLDQGLVVLMIENYRSGLVWKLMRSSSIIRAGLERAGFEGGWL